MDTQEGKRSEFSTIACTVVPPGSLSPPTKIDVRRHSRPCLKSEGRGFIRPLKLGRRLVTAATGTGTETLVSTPESATPGFETRMVPDAEIEETKRRLQLATSSSADAMISACLHSTKVLRQLNDCQLHAPTASIRTTLRQLFAIAGSSSSVEMNGALKALFAISNGDVGRLRVLTTIVPGIVSATCNSLIPATWWRIGPVMRQTMEMVWFLVKAGVAFDCRNASTIFSVLVEALGIFEVVFEARSQVCEGACFIGDSRCLAEWAAVEKKMDTASVLSAVRLMLKVSRTLLTHPDPDQRSRVRDLFVKPEKMVPLLCKIAAAGSGQVGNRAAGKLPARCLLLLHAMTKDGVFVTRPLVKVLVSTVASVLMKSPMGSGQTMACLEIACRLVSGTAGLKASIMHNDAVLTRAVLEKVVEAKRVAVGFSWVKSMHAAMQFLTTQSEGIAVLLATKSEFSQRLAKTFHDIGAIESCISVMSCQRGSLVELSVEVLSVMIGVHTDGTTVRRLCGVPGVFDTLISAQRMMIATMNTKRFQLSAMLKSILVFGTWSSRLALVEAGLLLVIASMCELVTVADKVQGLTLLLELLELVDQTGRCLVPAYMRSVAEICLKTLCGLSKFLQLNPKESATDTRSVEALDAGILCVRVLFLVVNAFSDQFTQEELVEKATDDVRAAISMIIMSEAREKAATKVFCALFPDGKLWHQVVAQLCTVKFPRTHLGEPVVCVICADGGQRDCSADEEPDVHCGHGVMLPCHHIFHSKCLLEWFDSDIQKTRALTSVSCPICRSEPFEPLLTVVKLGQTVSKKSAPGDGSSQSSQSFHSSSVSGEDEDEDDKDESECLSDTSSDDSSDFSSFLFGPS